MSLEHDVDAYLTFLRVERALAAHTIVAYGHDLGRLLAFLAARAESGHPPVEHARDLDLATVSAWLPDLSQSGLSARSMARRLSALRGLVRFLVDERRLHHGPTQLGPAPRHGLALASA